MTAAAKTSVSLVQCLYYIVLLCIMLPMSTSSLAMARTFCITGATDGIGRHTAQKLASDGHGLIVHGRRPEAGAKLQQDLLKRGAAFCHYINCDLADLAQVKQFASLVKQHVDKVDVLINNAGVFDPTPRYSAQGYDMTWAVNVMAPFCITRSMLPLMVHGSDQRIITTSSISQSYSMPDLDKLFAHGKELESLPYSAHDAYSNSKLGDYMYTAKLAKVLKEYPQFSHYKCLTMDPGTVNTKMLLAGWGACGIPVKRADNTYKLAATDYGAQQASGSYHFGGGGSQDAKNQAKLDALWDALEQHTDVTYSDIGSIQQ